MDRGNEGIELRLYEESNGMSPHVGALCNKMFRIMFDGNYNAT